MFWRLVESTGWTWDYVRSLSMPRFWKIVGAMLKANEGDTRTTGSAAGAGETAVEHAEFGG